MVAWTEENLTDAVKRYKEGLNRGNKAVKLGTLAREYGIPYNTLKYRITGKHQRMRQIGLI